MNDPEIVFFDMDHTLLDMDCDFSWKVFLADQGLAPAPDREQAAHYLNLYHRGITPVEEFLQFQLREFIGHTPEEMCGLAQRHFETHVSDHIFPRAQGVIAEFASTGVPTALLTGTNRIIAEPVSRALGISDLLATELETIDGRFTGRITGPYLSKEGKLNEAIAHCREMKTTLDRSAFFADSINDVQMLEKVGWPVAVNPKENLLAVAKSRNWQILYWSL